MIKGHVRAVLTTFGSPRWPADLVTLVLNYITGDHLLLIAPADREAILWLLDIDFFVAANLHPHRERRGSSIDMIPSVAAMAVAGDTEKNMWHMVHAPISFGADAIYTIDETRDRLIFAGKILTRPHTALYET